MPWRSSRDYFQSDVVAMRTREVKELLDCVAYFWTQPEDKPPKLTISDGELILVMFEKVGDSFVERFFTLDVEHADIPVKVIIEGITKALEENGK